MKKIILILLSVILVVSSSVPFLGSLTAKANTDDMIERDTNNTDENTLEYLTLKRDGVGEIEITKETKEILVDLEKHSEIENESIEMNLPSGFSYDGKDENINYNKKENKLEIKLKEISGKMTLPLAVDTEKMKNDVEVLKATLEGELPEKETDEDEKENENLNIIGEENVATPKVALEEEKTEEKEVGEKTLTSNFYKVKVVNQLATANQEENTTPENEGAITPANEGEDISIEEDAVDNGTGMTTKEGVPNAPKPDVITHAEASNEADVSNWTEFEAAMLNKNINVIHVQADFNNTRTTAVETNVITPSRTLTIKGNGHIIDFRGIGFRNGTTVPANTTIEWTVENLTMYGRNYYGPVHTLVGVNANNSYGALIYKDVTYVGAQLTASYYWTIDFGGKIQNHSVNSYVSPIDNTTQSAQINQVNIEAKNMVFRKGGNYNGTTQNAGVFYLGQSGAIILEDETKVTLTSGGAGGEAGTYALYLNGFIKTGEKSELTVNSSKTGNQYGVYISGAGNGIQADQDSTVNITTNGAYPTIHMETSTSIVVEDGATLNVHSKTRGTSGYDVIQAGYGYVTLVIGKKATFNVTSDGTGSHYLIRLAANANFQFADAEKVNLQFTSENINTNSRVIYMSGKLEVDIQDVKAWNRTTTANNNSTRDADYHWTPMFGMITSFNGATGTVNSASSVLKTERERYVNEFKPQNFSRILYSYIEDVEVKILNPLTDNVTNENSSVVKGVTNPGAYVRLTGDSALPDPKIPSIITGAEEAELTNDFTVIADENGKFEVKAKEAQHFTASNKIKAFAFLGGKSAMHTVTVLDETAPTGKGVNLSMIYGEKLPNPKQFIINPKDTNPANKEFTYEYKEDYSALANEEGIHDIIVVLGDEAGNKTDIPVQLEVTKDGYGVKADDITVQLSELKKYDTDAKMNVFLLEESKATGYGILENESIDLTEHLVVDDLANITQMKAGKYDIKFGFDLGPEQPDAKAKGSFIVTVLNDEAVKPTNPENPGAGVPEEVENGGTGQTGLLKLDYAPSAFDFGEILFGFDRVETNAVKTTSDKQWLQVSDNREKADITNWSVQVSQNHALATNAGEELKGATIIIPKGKVYNEATGEEEVTTGQLTAKKVDITTTPTMVFSANNQSEKVKDISTNVWKATDVKLEIPGGQEVEFGDYSNELTWSLVAEPSE